MPATGAAQARILNLPTKFFTTKIHHWAWTNKKKITFNFFHLAQGQSFARNAWNMVSSIKYQTNTGILLKLHQHYTISSFNIHGGIFQFSLLTVTAYKCLGGVKVTLYCSQQAKYSCWLHACWLPGIGRVATAVLNKITKCFAAHVKPFHGDWNRNKQMKNEHFHADLVIFCQYFERKKRHKIII